MSTQREIENTERAKSMERRHEEKKRNEEYKQPSQRGSTDSREKKKTYTKNAETNDKASNNVFMNANIDEKSSLS